jgi:hypothetical protein
MRIEKFPKLKRCDHSPKRDEFIDVSLDPPYFSLDSPFKRQKGLADLEDIMEITEISVLTAIMDVTVIEAFMDSTDIIISNVILDITLIKNIMDITES